MRTLRSLLLSFSFLITAHAVKAEEPTVKLKGTRGYAVSAYVRAMTDGKNTGLAEVIDPSAMFTTLRGKHMISFERADVLKFVEQNQNIRQNCTTTTSEIESKNELSVVKVEMKYENFTRINYVTLANTGDGWKITNVYSVFK